MKISLISLFFAMFLGSFGLAPASAGPKNTSAVQAGREAAQRLLNSIVAAPAKTRLQMIRRACLPECGRRYDKFLLTMKSPVVTNCFPMGNYHYMIFVADPSHAEPLIIGFQALPNRASKFERARGDGVR